jgi:hypothetical protein
MALLDGRQPRAVFRRFCYNGQSPLFTLEGRIL